MNNCFPPQSIFKMQNINSFRWQPVFSISLLALCAGLCGCAQTTSPVEPITFRVMTYNIHHAEGLDEKVDTARIAELIKQQGADLVALQEVDKGVRRTAGRDLTAELAAQTGLTGVFSNNFYFQGGEYGNAVLSRFPIKRWTNHHYQMLHPGEQRGLLELELDIHGRKVVFMCTHIDYRSDDSERWQNVSEIETWTERQSDAPTILCGDFNSLPEGRVYERLTKTFHDTWATIGTGDGFSFPSRKPNRRIDYIWFNQPQTLKPLRIWLPQSEASDHLPLVTEFQLR